MAEAASFFNKTLANELQMQQQISKDQVASLNASLKEQKQDLAREKEIIEHRLHRSETENAELQAMEQSLKEQVQKQTIDSESALRIKEDELDNLKKDLKRVENSYQLKMQAVES